MEVKLSPFIVFFVCVTLGLHHASANIKEMTLKTVDGEKTCTTKYTTCTLTIDSNPVMERGEKGDIGFPGPQGSVGEKGDRGFPGFVGLPGMKGEPGLNGKTGPQGSVGEKGDRGFPGFVGLPGMKGEPGLNGKMGPQGSVGEKGDRGVPGFTGLPGMKGEPGLNGEMGPAGPKGSPGPAGPPGAPGSHGVCPCYDTPNDPPAIEHDDDDFGTAAWPAEVPCKSAGVGVHSGTYHLGPTGKPIEVFCNMTSLETCIRIRKKTPDCNHNFSKGAFWLNEMGVDMKELYHIISAEQLTWLRDRSDSVRQTLKYNCLGSVPYSTHNMSSSVKLWAWNDVVIGPYPTNHSPIFYSVPESTDKCKEGSTEWKSTIIELQSSNVYRLPIVNMWIGDIRNANQKMSIESVELCFG